MNIISSMSGLSQENDGSRGAGGDPDRFCLLMSKRAPGDLPHFGVLVRALACWLFGARRVVVPDHGAGAGQFMSLGHSG
jgi:hypothetical protein